MRRIKILAALVVLLGMTLFTSETSARGRSFQPVHGRFPQRDPGGYADGINPYEYVGSNPANVVDPTGSWSEPIRWRQSRAWVCCNSSWDTWDSLGQLTRLEPTEYRDWVKRRNGTPVGARPLRGEIYTVPNVVYLDVGHIPRWADRPPSVWHLVFFPWMQEKGRRRGREGYQVIDNLHQRLSSLGVQVHLGDPDLAEYHWPGEGAFGLINTGPGDGGLIPGKYVHHRIAELSLLGCETARPEIVPPEFYPFGWRPGGVSHWELNVSRHGRFLGYRGRPAMVSWAGGWGEVDVPGGLVFDPTGAGSVRPTERLVLPRNLFLESRK